MKTNISLIYILLLLFSASCDDFLEEKPSKTTSIVPETTDHLESLLNDYSSFYEGQNNTATFSSDDYGLYEEIHKAKSTVYKPSAVMFACWDTEILPTETRDEFWTNEHKKIFTANMVLDYLPKVTGSKETKALLEAEAHLIRAYSMWELANTYCLPWCEANKNEPGLVLKLSTDFEESMKRSTLQQTYAQIESDLTEALKMKKELTAENGKYRIWRASLPAVHAFAARYYLFCNNYSEALKYAELALKEHNDLVDYNTDMRYSTQTKILTVNGQEVEIKYPYTYEAQRDINIIFEWKEFYYLRLNENGQWWFIPSQELLNLYTPHDLRYRYHYVLNYSYDNPGGMIDPAYEWPGYIFFAQGWVPSGPTVAEMLLTKAECQARQGNYTDAMKTVNILRAKRISQDAPQSEINLSAASKEEAIGRILEERRREMPFSIRWFDIRRFNNNEDAQDDVVITRRFYPYTSSSIRGNEAVKTYTLEKNSRRYAQPILNTEIESSRGVIEQNRYN